MQLSKTISFLFSLHLLEFNESKILSVGYCAVFTDGYLIHFKIRISYDSEQFNIRELKDFSFSLFEVHTQKMFVSCSINVMSQGDEAIH